MQYKKIKSIAITLGVILPLLFLSSRNTYAVPSFERQTGMSCTVCHTVFPELTPFGRIFKLNGYLFSKYTASKEFHPPLAAMVQLSYTYINKEKGVLKDGAAPFDNADDSSIDKINSPQQASVFYGGRIIDSIGAFVQMTYDGLANDFVLDNTDIRYAKNTTLGGKNLIYGLTVNNAPTVQDVWNTTPVWGFPYGASGVAPTPAASTVIDGGLGQQVGGMGAYVFWNNLIYGEGSVYRTTRNNITRPLGAGTSTDTVVDGAVPYWRLALEHLWNGKHSFEIGTYGLFANIYPSGNTYGPHDNFTDMAMDAQYQYIGTKHIFSTQTTWIHEEQDWDASFALGSTAKQSNSLDTFKINSNYFYKSYLGTIGGSLSYFLTMGDTDTLLYAPGSLTGSRTGSPDSNGLILEMDYVFKNKYKFSVQYTVYDKFNGADSNYDGVGRDASDNNTIYLFAWLMF
jgi:hypothetical protein